jgi:REP element-mobilizing transposase RayT
MRKTFFINGEIYHVYNRGVDKRAIIIDHDDVNRFFQSMIEFNTLEPIGSIYENFFRKKQLGGSASKKSEEDKRLVDIICYCINPNHFHFILRQVSDKGIEKFMQRLGTGYTMYFNNRNKRSGVLFQGKFKAIHVTTNEYLLRLSVYVNLNFRVHKYEESIFPLIRSSWEEYIGKRKNEYCKKDIVLGQLRYFNEYADFAKDALDGILERKQLEKEYLME